MENQIEQMIANYENLSEAEQAHVDAAIDWATTDHTICECGKKVDDCADAYSHMSKGY